MSDDPIAKGKAAFERMMDNLRFDALPDERKECNEDTPLSLTPRQRSRLLALLRDEFGEVSASKAIERIEREV